MVMPVVICGKSATGKDFIAKNLIKNHEFSKIITYTTRQPREGERDGINYHFRDRGTFKKMLEEGKFFEYKLFESNNEYYGTSIESIDNAINSTQNTVLILETEGVNNLIDAYHDNIFVVYLDTSPDVLKARLLERHKDNIFLAEERYKKEINDDWRKKLNRIDLTIDSSKDINIIIDEILTFQRNAIENGINKKKVKKNKLPI